jgi:hypothetical protein
MKTGFTESDKAAIFVRDKGTCCFTGKSLWLLDYGATPFWEQDWADHIVPASRRGDSTLKNGVCASYTSNHTKSNNGRDTGYLLREGTPTDYFARYVGPVPPALQAQLIRLSGLRVSDWYFNRCLAAIFIGFDNRREKSGYSRDWVKTGWNFLVKYQRLVTRHTIESMEARGIILRPMRADMRLMLRLRSVFDESEYYCLAESLFKIYDTNCKAFECYFYRKMSPRQRGTAFSKAMSIKGISPLVKSVIGSHHAAWMANH